MPIPDYQSFMLPLLGLLADGRPRAVNELRPPLAAHFKLEPSDLAELLPSRRQTVFANRVGWAGTYLRKAGLLDSPRRAVLQLTEAGREFLRSKPKVLTAKTLERYPAFVEFRKRTSSSEEGGPDPVVSLELGTPEETLDSAYERFRASLETELLDQVLSCSPRFFEELVVDVLVAMGYGGNRKDAGQAVGSSGDEGIDGIIKEDRLGLDTIYLQAKRWKDSVGRPEVQKFAGALDGKHAHKGIFITTGTFSRDAHDYVASIKNKVIVLIDGHRLTQLMVDHNVGVSPTRAYELKSIDHDYFPEE